MPLGKQPVAAHAGGIGKTGASRYNKTVRKFQFQGCNLKKM